MLYNTIYKLVVKMRIQSYSNYYYRPFRKSLTFGSLDSCRDGLVACTYVYIHFQFFG